MSPGGAANLNHHVLELDIGKYTRTLHAHGTL